MCQNFVKVDVLWVTLPLGCQWMAHEGRGGALGVHTLIDVSQSGLSHHVCHLPSWLSRLFDPSISVMDTGGFLFWPCRNVKEVEMRGQLAHCSMWLFRIITEQISCYHENEAFPLVKFIRWYVSFRMGRWSFLYSLPLSQTVTYRWPPWLLGCCCVDVRLVTWKWRMCGIRLCS